MDYPVRLQLAVAFLCIIEAILEKYVIAMKNPYLYNYAELNRKEHQWSGLYWFAVVIFYGVISWDFRDFEILLPIMVCERRVFFEYTLKLVRNKPLKAIEGDQFWDDLSRRVFGKNGGWLELMLLMGTIIGLNMAIS